MKPVKFDTEQGEKFKEAFLVLEGQLAQASGKKPEDAPYSSEDPRQRFWIKGFRQSEKREHD